MPTASAALAELRPFFPTALLDGAGWDRLLARVCGLPSEALEHCGFEFRLNVPEPAADMFVAAAPDSPVGQHLISQGDAAAPRSPEAALARHLRALADAESPRGDEIAVTGLEYDIAEQQQDERPPPGVFFQLRPKFAAGAQGRQELPIPTLAKAVGWEGDADEQRAVERALAALPSGAVVSFIGALPGRTPRAIRLVVSSVGHQRIAPTLERLGWRGSTQAAADLLEGVRSYLPTFRLAVDVAAAGLSTRVGFELFVAARRDGEERGDAWLATSRVDWQPVTAAMIERGWCLPTKGRGLLDWCSLERLYDRTGMRFLHKGINHVKLTLAAGAERQDPAAKAYGGMLFVRVE